MSGELCSLDFGGYGGGVVGGRGTGLRGAEEECRFGELGVHDLRGKRVAVGGVAPLDEFVRGDGAESGVVERDGLWVGFASREW